MTKRRGRKKRLGFKGLARRVEGEYKRKGFSASRSKRIGNAVAGIVFREKMAKAKKRRRRR